MVPWMAKRLSAFQFDSINAEGYKELVEVEIFFIRILFSFQTCKHPFSPTRMQLSLFFFDPPFAFEEGRLFPFVDSK